MGDVNEILGRRWGDFFPLIMSHQENNACLQGRNVSSPDGEETIPGKRETTSRRRVIFCTLFSKTSARLRQLCSQRGIPQFVKPTQPWRKRSPLPLCPCTVEYTMTHISCRLLSSRGKYRASDAWMSRRAVINTKHAAASPNSLMTMRCEKKTRWRFDASSLKVIFSIL